MRNLKDTPEGEIKNPYKAELFRTLGKAGSYLYYEHLANVKRALFRADPINIAKVKKGSELFLDAIFKDLELQGLAVIVDGHLVPTHLQSNEPSN